MGSRHIPEDIKFEVLLRSAGACEVCGAQDSRADFDHWHIPYVVCKSHDAWNIRFICSTCNHSKGKKMEPFGYRQENLHTHQAAMLAALQSIPDTGGLFGERQAKVIVAGTASGKTRVLTIHAYNKAAFIAASQGFKAKGSLSVIVTPNRATAKRFTEEYRLLVEDMEIYGSMLPKDIPVINGTSVQSELSAGLANQPVIVITAATLNNRLKNEKVRKILNSRIGSLSFDEAQYTSAKTLENIIAAIPECELVYASGTIIRHDKAQLPSAPYECQDLGSGRTLQIIQDVATLSGIPEARYTRAKSREDQVIKALAREPHWISLEDLFGRAGSNHIAGKTLQDFRDEARENQTRFDPYMYETVLRVILEIALGQYKSYASSPVYRIPGRQLKAIGLASTQEQAERAARIANEAGWNAVAYYADKPKGEEFDDDEEAGVTKQMAARLAEFESDEPGSPNLIIQCNTLSIGYDHSQIFMGIPLRGVGSRSYFDQFAGREARLMRDALGNRLLQSAQPPQCIVALDFGSTADAVRWYWEEDTELSQIIGKGGGDGGGGGLLPLAYLDGFTSYSRINGQWAEWTKSKESESDEVRVHREQYGDEAAESLKGILEAKGHATTLLPDELMKDGRPKTFNDFQQEFNAARNKIASHLYAILGQRGHTNFDVQVTVKQRTETLKAWVHVWSNRAINSRYPQLKGPINTWDGDKTFAACTAFAAQGVDLVRGDAEALMTEALDSVRP